MFGRQFSSLVLRTPLHIIVQFSCGAEREVGVAKELPADHHHVGESGRHDLFRLVRLVDHADVIQRAIVEAVR